MAFTFICGGMLFIINNTSNSLGLFLNGFFEQSFATDPIQQTGWLNSWSIFYWAWWIGPTPINALFFIKLAKGRTLRQFVLVNLAAPSLFGMEEGVILTIADSSTKSGIDIHNEQKGSPNVLKVFWGLVLGGCAYFMIINGGLSGVQTAAIICALPSMILILFMMAGFFRLVKNPKKYQLDMYTAPEEKFYSPSEQEAPVMAAEAAEQNA